MSHAKHPLTMFLNTILQLLTAEDYEPVTVCQSYNTLLVPLSIWLSLHFWWERVVGGVGGVGGVGR